MKDEKKLGLFSSFILHPSKEGLLPEEKDGEDPADRG
jgi:hypothetical protein